jgi:hypothetical protein
MTSRSPSKFPGTGAAGLVVPAYVVARGANRRRASGCACLHRVRRQGTSVSWGLPGNTIVALCDVDPRARRRSRPPERAPIHGFEDVRRDGKFDRRVRSLPIITISRRDWRSARQARVVQNRDALDLGGPPVDAGAREHK